MDAALPTATQHSRVIQSSPAAGRSLPTGTEWTWRSEAELRGHGGKIKTQHLDWESWAIRSPRMEQAAYLEMHCTEVPQGLSASALA